MKRIILIAYYEWSPKRPQIQKSLDVDREIEILVNLNRIPFISPALGRIREKI